MLLVGCGAERAGSSPARVVAQLAQDSVRAGVLSSDGRLAATVDERGGLSVWNVASGRQLVSLRGGYTEPVRFSKDARHVLVALSASWPSFVKVGVEDLSRRTWRASEDARNQTDEQTFADAAGALGVTLATARPTTALPAGRLQAIEGVSPAPSGAALVTSSASGAWLWHLDRRELPQQTSAFRDSVSVASFERHVVLLGDEDRTVFDWRGYGESLLPRELGSTVYDLSADNWLLMGNDSNVGATQLGGVRPVTYEWTPSAKTSASRSWLGYDAGALKTARFTPGVPFVVGVENEQAVLVWEARTGKLVTRVDTPGNSKCAAVVRPDKLWVVAAGEYGRVFDIASGRLLWTTPWAGWEGCRIAPDGKTAILSDAVVSFEGKTLFDGHGDFTARAFSEDGGTALVSTDAALLRLNAQSGRVLDQYELPDGGVNALAFVGEEHIEALGADGGVHLFRVGRFTELMRLHTRGNRWIVVDPEGRFDTNDVESVKDLAVVLPDVPFEPAPADMYLRAFYVPGLTHRLWREERLDAVTPIATLDRRLPTIRFEKVSIDPASGTAKVQLSVSMPPVRGNQARAAYQLRLFRDGQLVAELPRAIDDEISPGSAKGLQNWRDTMAIPLDEQTNRASLPPIRVRLRSEASNSSLSAYAFNGDRVRGNVATVSLNHTAPRAAKGRTIFVAIGVGGRMGSPLSIQFVAESARAVRSALVDALREQAPPVGEIVHVSLISDPLSGQPRDSEIRPDKHNITLALQLLGGAERARDSAPDALRGLPAVGPDDSVILYIAAHGLRHESGEFFILPDDMPDALGNEYPESVLRKHALSSVELARLVRAIDAGYFAIVLDTCHAAAAIQTAAFKPGPLGDPGLGQLAYDKQIQLLAATQADDVATSGSGGFTLLAASLLEAIRPVGSGAGVRDFDELLRSARKYATARSRELLGRYQEPEFFDNVRTIAPLQFTAASKVLAPAP